MAASHEFDPQRFCSVAAVAQRWGQREQAVRDKIASGALPARKLGRGWAVHGSVVLAYERGTDFAPEVSSAVTVLRPA